MLWFRWGGKKCPPGLDRVTVVTTNCTALIVTTHIDSLKIPDLHSKGKNDVPSQAVRLFLRMHRVHSFWFPAATWYSCPDHLRTGVWSLQSTCQASLHVRLSSLFFCCKRRCRYFSWYHKNSAGTFVGSTRQLTSPIWQPAFKKALSLVRSYKQNKPVLLRRTSANKTKSSKTKAGSRYSAWNCIFGKRKTQDLFFHSLS